MGQRRRFTPEFKRQPAELGSGMSIDLFLRAEKPQPISWPWIIPKGSSSENRQDAQ